MSDFISSASRALSTQTARTVPGRPRIGSWAVVDEKGLDMIEFTSFIGLNISSDADAPRHPLEEGGFYTANKVASPIEASVTLSVQGDSATFQSVLEKLNTFTREARLISVVTPEREFSNMTLIGFSYPRNATDGISMLTVELKIREVRHVPARYSSTAITEAQAKNSSDVSIVNTGQKRTKYRPELITYAI